MLAGRRSIPDTCQTQKYHIILINTLLIKFEKIDTKKEMKEATSEGDKSEENEGDLSFDYIKSSVGMSNWKKKTKFI